MFSVLAPFYENQMWYVFENFHDWFLLIIILDLQLIHKHIENHSKTKIIILDFVSLLTIIIIFVEYYYH